MTCWHRGLVLCLTLIFSGILSQQTNGEEKYTEADYIKAAAKTYVGAKTEVRMPNGTIADIITPDLAIEVEFAPKWAESIGQALSYAHTTGKEPCVLLLLREPKDTRFVRRILPVAKRVNVTVLIYHVTEVIDGP